MCIATDRGKPRDTAPPSLRTRPPLYSHLVFNFKAFKTQTPQHAPSSEEAWRGEGWGSSSRVDSYCVVLKGEGWDHIFYHVTASCHSLEGSGVQGPIT